MPLAGLLGEWTDDQGRVAALEEDEFPVLSTGAAPDGGSLGCNRTTTVDIYGRTMEHTDENTLTKS